MNYLKNLVFVGVFFVTRTVGEASELDYGPPVSPLAWQESQTKPGGEAMFSPPRNVLGVSKEPSSVKMVELQDQRPYGEEGRKTVWLARYESVPIQGPDSSMTAVPLSLALDGTTNELLCAFTDAAPHWARSTLEHHDIQERMERNWGMSPARYEDLHSTVAQVLGELWKNYGADPSKRGQIIIRPRLVAKRFLKLDAEGNVVPQDPPSNLWIVELLGAVVMERHRPGEEGFLTTRVIMLHDGNFEFSGGMILP